MNSAYERLAARVGYYLQEDEKGEKRPGLQSSLTMKRVSLELAGHWTCSLLLGTVPLILKGQYFEMALYYFILPMKKRH